MAEDHTHLEARNGLALGWVYLSRVLEALDRCTMFEHSGADLLPPLELSAIPLHGSNVEAQCYSRGYCYSHLA
jgi:hypothetical protein